MKALTLLPSRYSEFHMVLSRKDDSLPYNLGIELYNKLKEKKIKVTLKKHYFPNHIFLIELYLLKLLISPKLLGVK